MREILFRAYHIPTKRLLCVYGFNKENVFEETFDGIDIGTNVLPLSQCILQQFTGLTDKNGTKIFEGDQLFVAPGYSSVVSFEDGMFVSIYYHPEDGETLPLIEIDPEKCLVIN